jgi:carbohydrate diacid regulator
MIIPDILAQGIVDTAQCLIHGNVNIMNRDGVIIATSQSARRGTFHKGARDVIETGAAVEIYPGEISHYPGAREGVNLPIVLDGHIIGVIGVTGAPDAVRGLARLIKMITEMILERDLLKQEMQSRLRLRDHLVEQLLRGGTLDRGRILRTAKALGLNMGTPRIAAVADVTGPMSGFFSRYGASELVAGRSAEAILEALEARGVLGAADLGVILDEKLIMLVALDGDDAAGATRAFAARLFAAFEELGQGELACGAGALALDLAEYAASYRQAVFCLNAATAKRPFCSVYDHDACVGHLAAEAAASQAGMALRPLRDKLRRLLEKKPVYAATIAALFAHNFEMEPAADALGVHRNTLGYRLAGLREAVGLDPARRLDDAVLLRVLMPLGDGERERSGEEPFVNKGFLPRTPSS